VPNFATQQVGPIQLVVGQSRKLDVQLNIGSVSKEIRVEDTALLSQLIQLRSAVSDRPAISVDSCTGYIGSWGDHQFTRTYHNNYLYGTLTRPYPAFGQVDYKDAISTSNFNGWQTSLQRQFHSGLGLQFNYLWSHSINDGTTGGGESTYPITA
jgi:hypothetical protein